MQYLSLFMLWLAKSFQFGRESIALRYCIKYCIKAKKHSYFSDRHGFYIGFHNRSLQIGHWWMARHVPQPNHRGHRIRQHFQCHFPRLRFIFAKPISTRISRPLGQRGRYGWIGPLHPQRHLLIRQSGRQIVRIRLFCLCFSRHNHYFRPYIFNGKIWILPILFG